MQRIAELRRVAADYVERHQHQSENPVQNTTTTTNPPYLSVAPVNPKKAHTKRINNRATHAHCSLDDNDSGAGRS